MIKNIVFDMGGVLIDYNVQKTLDEFFPSKYHDLLREKVFESELWQQMDKGTVRYEQVIEAVVPLLPKETQQTVASMLTNFYKYMQPIDKMEGFILRLKKAGYKVFLLSNATPRFFDEYTNYPSLMLMDGYFISALYHLLKPQKEIYEAFCNKFSLKAEECFFIDDMPQNIQGAKNYGMKGFVFDTKDLAFLEKTLNSYNVEF